MDFTASVGTAHHRTVLHTNSVGVADHRKVVHSDLWQALDIDGNYIPSAPLVIAGSHCACLQVKLRLTADLGLNLDLYAQIAGPGDSYEI